MVLAIQRDVEQWNMIAPKQINTHVSNCVLIKVQKQLNEERIDVSTTGMGAIECVTQKERKRKKTKETTFGLHL